MANDDNLVFNGIDGTTGAYLLPQMAPQAVADVALLERWNPAQLSELKFRWNQKKDADQSFGLEFGRDPRKLEESGWCVIFPAEADAALVAAISEALKPLLDLRRSQAQALYREFKGASGDLATHGYHRDATKNGFLADHGAGPGPVDPTRVPYYVLLVGDPESIPYSFQYELDVAYAVGRIHFELLDEYAQYAASVVAAETGGQVQLGRRATFVAVANDDDKATNQSSAQLIQPLAGAINTVLQSKGWQVNSLPAAQAHKSDFARVLGGADTPAFLFTASHGMGFPLGHAKQLPFQGALLTQDWPGPNKWVTGQEIPEDFYFGASDVGNDANLLGLIAFMFACYGAGTPYFDDFARQAFKTRSIIAPNAFVAALPKRLLSHPRGGALAVVGHIERAWTYSFVWQNAGVQTKAYESALRQLLDGYPVGAALDYINLRWAEISTSLSTIIDQSDIRPPDIFELAGLWTANNDARGYAIVGDPAVRLPVAAQNAAAAARPNIAAVAPNRDGVVPAIMVPQKHPAAPSVSNAADLSGMGGMVRLAAPSTVTGFGGAPADAAALGLGNLDLPDPGDILNSIRNTLTSTLQQLAGKLTEFVQDVSSLDVSTYVSDNIEQEQFDFSKNSFSAAARQRALTHIGFDGDIKVVVPTNAGTVDQALWTIHADMVAQAQANRAAMVKMIVETLADIVGPSKAQ